MNGRGQGRRISTLSDFAYTAVFESRGEQGTVYKIVFDNWEYPEGEKANWALFASLVFFYGRNFARFSSHCDWTGNWRSLVRLFGRLDRLYGLRL